MKFRTATAFLMVLTASLLVGELSAHAQYYRPYRPHSRTVMIYPKGLYVGGGIVGTRILGQQGGAELLDDGMGLSLYSGLRLNRSLALEAGWIGSLHNPETVDTPFGPDTEFLVLNGFTADAKVYVKTSNKNMEPYVQAGVGLYLLDRSDFGAQSVGTGFQAGGGLDFKIGGHVELGARALYRGMNMGPPDRGTSDTYVSALTVEGALKLRF